MKNNFYISFGVWLLILPFLGVPIVWRDALVFVSGLVLLLVYFWPTILGKLQTKPKKKITHSSPFAKAPEGQANPPYIKGETGKEIQKEEKEELRFSETSENSLNSPLN